MRVQLLFRVLVLVGSLILQESASAQSVSPNPVSMLTQSLAKAGGARREAFDDAHSFVASGTIKYFCEGQEESGSASVRGRGSDRFRLDVQLPEGLRSIVVDRGRGNLKEVTGPVAGLPYLNAVNMGNLVFPYPVIAAALADPRTLITYVGSVDIAGRPTHQLHVRRRYPPSEYPKQSNWAATTDYFLDAETGLVVRVADSSYPVDASWQDFPHEIDLGDYQIVSGINVPMRISEKFMAKTIWELRMNTVNFNSALSNSDFSID